jgi:hypothetical protein
VAHGYSTDASCAALGAVIDGEQDGFALLELDDFNVGLHARTLLGEDEFAASEVGAGRAEEEGDLDGEDEVTV